MLNLKMFLIDNMIIKVYNIHITGIQNVTTSDRSEEPLAKARSLRSIISTTGSYG